MKKLILLLALTASLLFSVSNIFAACFSMEKQEDITNVILVIDRSGSMEGRVMDNAKKSGERIHHWAPCTRSYRINRF